MTIAKINKKRLFLLISGLTIGITFLLYDLTLFYSLKSSYHPFLFRGEHDNISYQAHYIMYLNEALEGKLFPSDGVVRENRDIFINMNAIKAFLLGIIAKIFGLSAVQIYLLTKFVFGILLFLITYAFLKFCTNSALISYLGGFSLSLGLDLLWNRYTLVPEIIQFFTDKITYSSSILELSTFPEIIVSLTYFLFTLLTIFKVLAPKTIFNKKQIILAGFLFGGMSYINFHYFAELIIFYFLITSYYLLKRNKFELKKLLLIGAIAFPVILPYLYFYILPLSSGQFADLQARSAIVTNREITLPPLLIISLLALIFLYFKKGNHFIFLLFLLFADLIGMNAQVILGHDLISGHWFTRVLRPLSILSGFIIISRLKFAPQKIIHTAFLFFSKKKLPIMASSLIIVLLISNGVFKQISYAQRMAPRYLKFSTQVFPHFQWLKNNTQEDEVVLADPEISSLIPMYTQNYLFLSPGYSISSDQEIIDRLLIFFTLFQSNNQQITNFLQDLENQLFLFNAKYRAKELYHVNTIPSSEIEQLLTLYNQKYKNVDISALLNKYQINYIYFGPNEKRLSTVLLEKYPFIKKLYQKNQVTIYRVDLN